jgi:hypothetical protein
VSKGGGCRCAEGEREKSLCPKLEGEEGTDIRKLISSNTQTKSDTFRLTCRLSPCLASSRVPSKFRIEVSVPEKTSPWASRTPNLLPLYHFIQRDLLVRIQEFFESQ